MSGEVEAVNCPVGRTDRKNAETEHQNGFRCTNPIEMRTPYSVFCIGYGVANNWNAFKISLELGTISQREL